MKSGEKEKSRSANESSTDDSATKLFSRPKRSEKGVTFFSSRFPFLLCLLHLAVALPLAFVLNIWTDEASTLYTTRNGFLQAFQNVFADEKQAPLYFLFLSLWREIDDSIIFARFPSIVFSLLAIKFFYDLTRKFLDENSAQFVGFFFAIHPYLIWSSAEIRVYSPVILLSVLLLYFFSDGYANSEIENASPRKKVRIWFVLLAAVALYTNYYLGFLLVGGFVGLLVVRRFQAARDYFLKMMLVGIVFAPLL